MLPDQTLLSQLQTADIVLAVDLLWRDALVLLVASLHAFEDLLDRSAKRLLQPVDSRRDVGPRRPGLKLLKNRPVGRAREVVEIGPGLHDASPQQQRDHQILKLLVRADAEVALKGCALALAGGDDTSTVSARAGITWRDRRLRCRRPVVRRPDDVHPST